MLNAKTLGAVTHTHTHTQVVLNNMFLKINSRNKDLFSGLRLLYLRPEDGSFGV